MNRSVLVMALFGTLLLGGCAVGPDYRPPASAVRGAFGNAGDKVVLRNGPVPSAWWRLLDDPLLTALVGDALTANQDLETARARVRQARALRQVAAADYLPGGGASALYQRQQISGNGPFFPRIPGVFDRGPVDLFQTGFDASWELDLFGRIRRGVESAAAELEASEARQQDLLLSVAAEVARNYLELRADQQLAETTRRTADVQAQLLQLTETLAENGLASAVDVAGAEAEVEATRASLPGLEASASAAMHRLAVLSGREPLALLPKLAPPGALPDTPAQIAVGIPAELLRRRPDVRAAERELAAASARIGVATADLFPRITLSGNFAVSSRELASWFSGDSTLFGLGPKIVWPLFDMGRIRARIEVRDAEAQAALAQYRQTVLRVLEEAETSLSNFARSGETLALRQKSHRAQAEAVRLARIRYEQGLQSFMDVLQVQRDLYNTETALIRNQLQQAASLVALFKALGGGWGSEGQPRAVGTAESPGKGIAQLSPPVPAPSSMPAASARQR